MKVYLAHKFKGYDVREPVEEVLSLIEKQGHETVCFIRDFEKWGKVHFEPKDMMKKAEKLIKESDVILIEFSEKGVGIGIEAGLAKAYGKKIIVVQKEGTELSDTLKGILTHHIFYKNFEELDKKLKLKLK